MADTPTNPTAELGVAGYHTHNGLMKDEFLPQLRGRQAVKVYREMRENDAIIGAIMMAMDMMMRQVPWRVEPVDDSPQAAEAAEFLESICDDMSGTWEEFISELLSFLPYGFAFFEVVYKRRGGMLTSDSSQRSRYDDGLIGVRKIAPRAQWTIEEFRVDADGGLKEVVQNTPTGNVVIPISKGLLFRTLASNNSPSGRSVLRSAYRSWYYCKNIQEIESIAIERELNGLPVGRLPSEYLAADASADHQAIKTEFISLLRDVKRNEQSFVLLPSDPYLTADGQPTNHKLVEFELMASSGTRDIDTGKVIIRYQQDMARTVLADFLMLGQAERGSFALSKDKTDLFLRAIEGFLGNACEVINRHLVPKLWAMNGLNFDLMPRFVHGDVAPIDLEELGNYIQRLSGAGFPLFPNEELEKTLMIKGGLPEPVEDPDMMGLEDDETLDEDDDDDLDDA